MATWVGAAVGVAALHPKPVLAQADAVIEEFQVRVEVSDDGAIDVLENIRFRFTDDVNGIFRLIPIEYRTSLNFSKRIYLDLESVRLHDGSPLRHETSREGHYLKVKVWVPGARRDAERTVSIRYTVPNALLFFDTHDELYWNVTGDEWPMPIRRASALVDLPAGVEGLRAKAYTGPFGSTAQDARWQETESGFYFETTEGLDHREGLTVVVGWDPGVVDRPGIFAKAWLFLRANWLFGVPVLVTLGMARLWWTRGRDPSRRPVVARYRPPEGMTPSEIGTLVDNSPDMRDITADLVDLAVKGYIRIEEIEDDGLLGFLKGDDYRFVSLRSHEEWEGLPEQQTKLLRGLFGYFGSGSVRLSSLKNSFYTRIPAIEDAIFRRLVMAGYYRTRPDKVREGWLSAGVVFAIGVFAVGTGLAQFFGVSEITALAAGLLSAVPIFAFGWFMPARTVPGTRKLEEVLGFEEFLERVESDRFRRMITSPDLFERYLPHAMALDMEDRWAKAFEGMVKEPPDWYRGTGRPGHFRTTALAGDLGGLRTSAGSTMTSRPRSTGGSGFGGGGGGGGFSGGGMGGGGGGTF